MRRLFHAYGTRTKKDGVIQLANAPAADPPLVTLKDKRLPYTECAGCGHRPECLDGWPVGGCPKDYKPAA